MGAHAPRVPERSGTGARLYNVWSRLGRAHLEQLLEALRFVATDA